MKRITVIIPTLNEEKGIGKTIERIPKKRIGSLEILVVDGNSKDKTREIAKKMGARVIIEKRRGYGRAFKTGFQKAIGDIFITLDGDGTYPVEEIPKLVETLKKEKFDFVTTNRFEHMEKEAMSFRNKFGNKVLSVTCNMLFSTPFKDSQSGMWVLSKKAWNKIKNRVKSDGMAFSQEIKIEAYKALRCKEVPIRYGKRKGKAKLNAWKDGVGNLSALITKRFKE